MSCQNVEWNSGAKPRRVKRRSASPPDAVLRQMTSHAAARASATARAMSVEQTPRRRNARSVPTA